MGKRVGFILSIILAIFSLAFFTFYFLSFKEIEGMLYWLSPIRILFALILTAVYIVPVILLLIYRKSGERKHIKRIIIILMIIGLIINLSILYILVNHPTNSYTKPIILITDEVGVNGLANVVIIFNTQNKVVASMNITNMNSNETIILSDEIPMKKHVFKVKDLMYNTTYSYSLVDIEDIANVERTFTTPSSNTSLKIAFSSDFHFEDKNSDMPTELNILKYISNNYNCFIFGGDLTDWGFKNSDLIKYINAASDSISKVPSVYVMGNHDSMFGGEDYFYHYLSVYNNAREIKKLKGYESYCSHYKLNNFTHLITIDLEWGKGENIMNQLRCLDSELSKTSKEDWVIVSTHSFFYSSGSKILNKYWADQDSSLTSFFHTRFVDSGVDFVLSGHNHQLEILKNDGVNYIVAGGSGSKKETAPEISGMGSEWISYSENGFVDLNIVNESSAVVTFRNSSGGELYTKAVENH